MNESKKQNALPTQGKKTGDGLSKKERRALRVAQKGDGLPEKVETANTPNTQQRVCPPTPLKPAAIVNNQSKPEEIKPIEQPKDAEAKSKAQLKAERRALQEKQRLAKLPPKQEDSKLAPDTVITNNTAESNETKENSEASSKAQLKAERRALQEKQRLAKATTKAEPIGKKEPAKSPPKKGLALRAEPLSEHQVHLFNHLYFKTSFICETREVVADVHSAFIRLGVQYSSKTILGSNARCLALLSALRELINDFSTPPKQEFCRSLEAALQRCVLYLQKCRPLAVSMTNALRHFKLFLTQVNTNLLDDEKKNELIKTIDTYREDQIAKAGEAISMKVKQKITNDDIILTYGCSSLIRRLLLEAHGDGKKFKVIVVDSRPLLEGREMLRILISNGIDCTYVLINAVSFIMSKATKVLLGAHALLANGYVMSRTGTAQIALIAQAYNKPVLVCCETYKFSEKAQTDCFVYNEIGDPDMLVNIDTLEEDSPLTKWRSSKYLTPLNLLYDVTPPDLVTAVVTELGFLPCTSVPVVLRIKPTE